MYLTVTRCIPTWYYATYSVQIKCRLYCDVPKHEIHTRMLYIHVLTVIGCVDNGRTSQCIAIASVKYLYRKRTATRVFQ